MSSSTLDREAVESMEFLLDKHNADPHQGKLSAAETQVALHLSHGLSQAMIADTLGKSPETVKSQVVSARGAVNAKTSAHLVAIAIRRGLIR